MTEIIPSGEALANRSTERRNLKAKDEAGSDAGGFADLLAQIANAELRPGGPQENASGLPRKMGEISNESKLMRQQPPDWEAKSEAGIGSVLEVPDLGQTQGTKPGPDTFLGTAAPPPDQLASKQPLMAEIFNEHGLLQNLVQSGDGAEAVASRGVTDPQSDTHSRLPTSASALWNPAATSQAEPQAALPERADATRFSLRLMGPRAAGSAETTRPPTRMLSPHATIANIKAHGLAPDAKASQEDAQRAINTPDARATSSKSLSHILVQIQDYLRQASIDARVIVEMTEQGLRLVARAEKLTREQRTKLHDEIAQLLAGHGFVAAEIRLNGEAGRKAVHAGEAR